MDIIVAFLLGGGLFAILAVFAFVNLDKVELLLSWLMKGVSFILPFVALKNRATAFSIQAHINRLGEQIERKAPGVMPAALKIELIRHSEHQVKTTEEATIIRINYNQNHDSMVAITCYQYVRSTFLLKGKSYMYPELRTAIDLSVAHSLAQIKDSSTLFFVENFIEPEISKNEEIRELISKLRILDLDGYFYEVYIRILIRMSERLFPTVANYDVLKETKKFLMFLHRIAVKRQSEHVDLLFTGKFISVNIILIRDRSVYSKYGVAAYVNRYLRSIEEGARLFFFKGIGDECIRIVGDVMRELREMNLIQEGEVVNRPLQFGSRSEKAVYAYVVPNLQSRAVDYLRHEEELERLLEQNITAIRENRVSIKKVAREKGVMSKVLVASADSNVSNAALACLGPRLADFNKLEKALGNERVVIVNFDTDERRMIVESLLTPDRRSGVSVNITEPMDRFDVIVPTIEIAKIATGRSSIGVRLSQRLLGVVIHVVVRSKAP